MGILPIQPIRLHRRKIFFSMQIQTRFLSVSIVHPRLRQGLLNRALRSSSAADITTPSWVSASRSCRNTLCWARSHQPSSWSCPASPWWELRIHRCIRAGPSGSSAIISHQSSWILPAPTRRPLMTLNPSSPIVTVRLGGHSPSSAPIQVSLSSYLTGLSAVAALSLKKTPSGRRLLYRDR